VRELVNLRRRKFLKRCCQGATAALLPARFSGFALRPSPLFASATPPKVDAQFHLHPHYRTPRPLDALLLKRQAGLDEFVSEKYSDQLGALLAEWSANLLQSPQQADTIERILVPGFSGCALVPVDSKLVRSHSGLEVRQNRFANQTTVGKDVFVKELQSILSSFAKVSVAEMQIVSIESDSSSPGSRLPGRLQTRVRFHLVGSGHDFDREQRVGHWDLEWEITPAGAFRLNRWRSLDETRSRTAGPLFTDITASAFDGVPSYSSQLLRGADYWRTVLDGASGIDIYGHNGVSFGDIDNDGYDDLYVCQPAGLPNRLYRNRGDGTFEDITETSGVGVLENTACALFADIDNDGRQDLIVVRTNGPLLFLNAGGGKFRQKPDAFHFANAPAGTFTGAAMADFDRDGWLDIYFCLYVYYQGAEQYKYPSPYYDAENGPPNFMLRNNRDGTFRDVTAESGLNQNNTRYSFCCGWNDYNHDGWPDLYVVNDFGRKNLYRNNGNGTFTDIAAQAGVEDIGAGMSVCWFDYDGDGTHDLYVANMWTAAGKRVAMQDLFQKDAPKEVRALYRKHAMGNSLFRSTGEGTFQDRSEPAGVGMGRWSWSSDSWDFDHDGFADLYVVNGMVSGPSRDDLNSFFWRQVVAKSPTTAKPSQDYEQGWSAINELIRADGTWSGYERNVFYANNRDGTFSDVSGVTGLDFLEDGRSFALADFDHDGRLEALVKNRNAPQIRLVKNVIKELAPSIAFRLQGTKSNRDAIGAVVTVETESGHQTRTLQAGSGFLSQHGKDVFFGLGEAGAKVRASIRWPSGVVQELRDLPVNHRVWVEEGSAPSQLEPFKARSGSVEPPVSTSQEPEVLPTVVETWLLSPVAAPEFALPDLGERTIRLSAFRGKPVVLHFWSTGAPTYIEDLKGLDRASLAWGVQGLQSLAVNLDDSSSVESLRALARQQQWSLAILRGSEDVAGIYNILYRYLYDRHRDLSLPTSFLIDGNGDIVKAYQGPLNLRQVEEDSRQIPRTIEERLAKALPFSGVTTVSEFVRNYLSYGSVFFQLGYVDQAGSSFQRALLDDPSSAEALYGLGSVYLQQKKAAQARESFERVTKLAASYPDTRPNAWNNLGLLATREGRTAEAISCFQEALRVSPDHLIALVNLGNAYRQQKQWEDARKTLERAVDVGPDDPEANYSLGMVFAQLNDTDRAYDYLQRALRLRPTYPEALNNLGILYLRTERRDEAIHSFEECIRVAPTFDQPYLNLARVYALEDHPGKARAVLLDLLKQHPDHALAQKALQELPQLP
jgi:tetratricopeptide (TPR) repeat protein